MILAILTDKEPILRKKSKKVKDPSHPDIQKLIDGMFESLREAKGVGLAAPQVGSPLRLCVIEFSGERMVLINPKIHATSKEKKILEEGCLSIPGEWYMLERPEKIKVRYLDENGKKCKLKTDGLLARAIQHEIDHLDGILITDRK